MNVLKGHIKEIQVNGELSIVRVDVSGIIVSTIVIDTPDTSSFLRLEGPVTVIFKETEVILGIGDMKGISLRNKFKGQVTDIQSDQLLSKVVVETKVGKISSIITSNAVNQLEIKIGSTVVAMVKTNEILLSE